MSFKSKFFHAFLALLLLSGLVGIQKAKACHFASADIVVNYIGSGMDGCSGTTEYKYEVLLTVYYACQGCTSAIGDTIRPATGRGGIGVGIYSNSLPGPNNWQAIGLKRLVLDTVSQICPNFKPQNSCNVLANRDKFPAYQREIFRGEIDLNTLFPGNMTQNDWTVWFNNSARPNPVNVNGGFFHIEAGFNNRDKYNASSPRFTGDALRYICINTKATYLNNVQDLNGDSLVVSPTDPLAGINTPLGYLGNFNAQTPLPSSGDNPYYVDPRTGTTTFTPTALGMWQLTFRVDKYERGTGKYLGFGMRDVQVQVMDCTEPPPALDPIPATISEGKVVELPGGAKVIYTCPGSTVSFSVNATAALSTSTIYMIAKPSLPAMASATFNPAGNGTTAVVGTFTWTPDIQHIGEHTLELTSMDSTCSGSGYTIVQKTSTVYTIIVTPGLALGPDISICKINSSDKQLFVRGTENLKVRWEEIIDNVVQPTPRFLSNPTIQNPIAKNPNIDVTYTVYSEDLVGSTCRNRDTVNLLIDKETTLDAFPDDVVVLCHPDFLQMDARLRGKLPTGNLACGDKDPVPCTNPETIAVFGSPSYGETTVADTLGSASPTFPNNVKTAKMQYLITKDEMTSYGFRSGSIKSIAFDVVISDATTGAVHPYQNFRIMMGCTQLTELKASTGFERDNRLTEVYNSGATPVFFPVGTNTFTLQKPYNWDTTQNLLITICYSNPTDIGTCTNPQGNAPVLRSVPTAYTSGLFYKAPTNVETTVCNVLTGTGFEPKAARPKFTFTYCEAPGKDFRFWWNPGALLSDSSIQQPLAYIPRTTKYMVETFGRRGCILRDSVMVYVPINNYNITPFDSTICFGAEATLQVNGTNTDSYLYKWYEYEDGNYKMATTTDCNTCRNVRVRPLKTTHYKIAVYDSVFCIDTVDAIVKVLPRPDVKLLTRDTVIRYGQSIQLQASGARQYSWIPSGSLSTPNTSAPLATPVEPTSYVVTGIAANGCRTMDTVRVDIDYRDNILVPTAFSPNGDGKNDVFRVANLTFQRIMEFRVFNRWGQEIYSTNDIKGGWDGTWKGEPQPVDNYRYLIRVAFPDGIVETYKGDVTLIR